ncbi:hypothetical protein EON63_19695, partial [archaeon]
MVMYILLCFVCVCGFVCGYEYMCMCMCSYYHTSSILQTYSLPIPIHHIHSLFSEEETRFLRKHLLERADEVGGVMSEL